MVINTVEIMDALQVIAEEEKVVVTIKSCVKSAVITGAMTFAGGLLLGPLGLALGGTLGGLTAYSSNTDLQPLWKVLQDDLSNEQKDRLAKHIEKIVKDFEIIDGIQIAVFLLSNATLKQRALQFTLKFVANELGVKQNIQKKS